MGVLSSRETSSKCFQEGELLNGSGSSAASLWIVPALRTGQCKQSKWRSGPPGSQCYSGVDCARAAAESESEDQALGGIGSFDFPALTVSTFLYSSLFRYHRASLPVPLSIFSLFSSHLHLYYSVCSEELSMLFLP